MKTTKESRKKSVLTIVGSTIGAVLGVGTSLFLSSEKGKSFRKKVSSYNQVIKEQSQHLVKIAGSHGEKIVQEVVRYVQDSPPEKEELDVKASSDHVKELRKKYGYENPQNEYNNYQF